MALMSLNNPWLYSKDEEDSFSDAEKAELTDSNSGLGPTSLSGKRASDSLLEAGKDIGTKAALSAGTGLMAGATPTQALGSTIGGFFSPGTIASLASAPALAAAGIQPETQGWENKMINVASGIPGLGLGLLGGPLAAIGGGLMSKPIAAGMQDWFGTRAYENLRDEYEGEGLMSNLEGYKDWSDALSQAGISQEDLQRTENRYGSIPVEQARNLIAADLALATTPERKNLVDQIAQVYDYMEREKVEGPIQPLSTTVGGGAGQGPSSYDKWGSRMAHAQNLARHGMTNRAHFEEAMRDYADRQTSKGGPSGKESEVDNSGWGGELGDDW